jgi:hypothetical protein
VWVRILHYAMSSSSLLSALNPCYMMGQRDQSMLNY